MPPPAVWQFVPQKRAIQPSISGAAAPNPVWFANLKPSPLLVVVTRWSPNICSAMQSLYVMLPCVPCPMEPFPCPCASYPPPLALMSRNAL
jgi:hypothetical protein